VEIEDDYGLN